MSSDYDWLKYVLGGLAVYDALNGKSDGALSGLLGGLDLKTLLVIAEAASKSGIFGSKPNLEPIDLSKWKTAADVMASGAVEPLRNSQAYVTNFLLRPGRQEEMLSRLLWGPEASVVKSRSDTTPLSLYGQDIGSEMNRVLAQPTGYGPTWKKAATESINAELNRANDEAMRRLGASMASRGLRGGVYNNAMILQEGETQRAREQALRDVEMAAAEADWKGRQAQNSALANLLGLKATPATGIVESELRDKSNLLNLLGTQSEQTKGIDSYKADLLGLLNQNAGQQAAAVQGGQQSAADYFDTIMKKYRTDAEQYASAMQGIFNMLGQAAGKPTTVVNSVEQKKEPWYEKLLGFIF